MKTARSSAVLTLEARRMSFTTGTLLCLRFVGCLLFAFAFLIFPSWQAMEPNLFAYSSPHLSSRRRWTSGPRFPLCSAVWLPTPTSRREWRSMRRRRALRPRARRHPRSVCPVPHFSFKVPPRYYNSSLILGLADWLIASVFSAAQLRLCAAEYMQSADNTIEWPFKKYTNQCQWSIHLFPEMSWSLLVTYGPFRPSPHPFLSRFCPPTVSQHGHTDGSLPAVSPEHFWCHPFPSTDMDCRDGRHHAVPPDCPHVLLLR